MPHQPKSWIRAPPEDRESISAYRFTACGSDPLSFDHAVIHIFRFRSFAWSGWVGHKSGYSLATKVKTTRPLGLFRWDHFLENIGKAKLYHYPQIWEGAEQVQKTLEKVNKYNYKNKMLKQQYNKLAKEFSKQNEIIHIKKFLKKTL